MEKGLYEWNKDGLNGIFEDVFLMCRNCREFNHAEEEYLQIADRMELHARTYFKETQLELNKIL